MEMPINIIVVLFVALIVGGAILLFSKNALNHAQQDLNDKWRDDPVNKESVIELGVASSAEIVNLANACVRKGRQSASVDSSLCFGVFATSITPLGPLQGTALDEGFTLDTMGVVGAPTAVRITYDPMNKIFISS
jgi:hypothetical protein